MKCTIMMGLPGSGKSTYCNAHLKDRYYLSADGYHIDADGEYRFKPEFAADAHAACKREFALWACGEGPSIGIAVDNTNLNIEDVAFYIECAMAFGHDVEIVFMHSNNAYARQTHGVPLNAWLHMVDRAKLTITSWPARWPRTTVIES